MKSAKREWTTEEDAALIELRRLGHGWESIAFNLGLSRETTRMRGLELDCPRFVERIVAHHDKIGTARSLWDDGLSAAEIGRRVSVSKSTLLGLARRHGFPSRSSPIVPRHTRTCPEVLSEVLTHIASGAAPHDTREKFGLARGQYAGLKDRHYVGVKSESRVAPVIATPGVPGNSYDPHRPVLPPGHEISWGAITRGTMLEGAPFA